MGRQSPCPYRTCTPEERIKKELSGTWYEENEAGEEMEAVVVMVQVDRDVEKSLSQKGAIGLQEVISPL